MATGPGVKSLKPGDRVAYSSAFGAYATERNLPEEKLVPLPDDIDDRTAAAVMLKGLTAQYLIRQTFRVERGQTVLVHAAAGGVGLLLCQWARHLGATVLGTVGSGEKAAIAREHGCDHTILYREEDFVTRVIELTNGSKCHVVYDGVGKATFPGSLDCLRPRGMFVSYGNASGAIEAFNILMLSTKGALYCTRPTLGFYATDSASTNRMAEELFSVIRSGAVRVRIDQTYPLAEAAQAHRDLQGRRTTGATVLIP